MNISNLLERQDSVEQVVKDARVLIIEDDRLQRLMLRQIFENVGVDVVEEAIDGQQGYNKTIEMRPDLVLLDITMPLMDGLEYCKEIRKDARFAQLPILVQTGLNEVEDIKKIFEAGASDYVSKPVHDFEILARSLTHLERNRYLGDLELYKRRVENELASARVLQNEIMPGQEYQNRITEKYGVTIHSVFQPCSEIAGDFWGVHEIDDDHFALYNVDFVGHGVEAALNTFRLHTLIQSHTHEEALDPAGYLTWLNDRLVELLPPGQYATMFYGVVNIKENILSYAPAACPDPIYIRKEGSEAAKMLSGRGCPLGIDKKATYENEFLPFEQGDFLMLYSDALTETPAKGGAYISTETIVEHVVDTFFKKHKPTEPQAFNAFLDWFSDSCTQPLRDDLTINVYYRTK